MVKNSSAMQETWVGPLGLEDPLEEEMATHFSILAWRIPWTEEPGELQSMRSQGVRHDRTHMHAQDKQSRLKNLSPGSTTNYIMMVGKSLYLKLSVFISKIRKLNYF